MRGEIMEKPNKGFDGSRGWMGNIHIAGEKVSCKDLIDTVLTTQFQHHYPLVRGNYENEVMECLNWLDVAPIAPVRYAPYLQKP
jgi:hypothetical protein